MAGLHCRERLLGLHLCHRCGGVGIVRPALVVRLFYLAALMAALLPGKADTIDGADGVPNGLSQYGEIELAEHSRNRPPME